MPQTTGCALTHRLPSNTTTAARPPADLPPLPVEEGRGGVRLHTTNAKSPAVLLPPPWGRIGVEAAKKRTATKPHQTSSFTYTPSAQAYVKKTIGCALGRVCNSNFPPLRCGGGAGRGCENRVATAFKTKCKQPIAHRLPSNTTTAARPPADLPPLPVEEGWGSPAYRQCKIARRSALSPVGEGWGGAAKKHAATQPHRTSSFIYTPSAQAYVNCPATP